MRTDKLNENGAWIPVPCGSCGGLMRLVGSEPDPVKVETDLLTYSCTDCGAFKVTAVPLPEPRV